LSEKQVDRLIQGEVLVEESERFDCDEMSVRASAAIVVSAKKNRQKKEKSRCPALRDSGGAQDNGLVARVGVVVKF